MAASPRAAASTPPAEATTTTPTTVADGDNSNSSTAPPALPSEPPPAPPCAPPHPHSTSPSPSAAAVAALEAAPAVDDTTATAATEADAAADAAVPSETHFASREQLLSYVHTFSLRHGYAVVIQKSNVPRGQLWLRCDLGGSYRSTNGSSNGTGNGGTRKRKCSSRLQNCPFQLYARRLPDARWLLRVQHSAHNHAVGAAHAPAQLTAHPIARRLTLEQKQLVDELTGLGARPAHILAKLQERFPDKPFKVQDIYNARNFIRRERGAGRVPFAAAEAAASPQQQCVRDSDGARAASTGSVVDTVGRSDVGRNAGAAAATDLTPVTASASLSAATRATSGGSSATSSDSGKAAPPPSLTASASTEPLQTLLGDVRSRFGAWQPRTQKQFVLQLDALLRKCVASDSRAVAAVAARASLVSSSSSAVVAAMKTDSGVRDSTLVAQPTTASVESAAAVVGEGAVVSISATGALPDAIAASSGETAVAAPNER